MTHAGRWRIGLLVVLLATVVRLAWAIAVPTIPVGDFATYRESAIYLAEFGHFDRGFIYMPGLVFLLAAIHNLGGEVLAAKILGAIFGGVAAGPIYAITAHLVDDSRRVSSSEPARSSSLSSSLSSSFDRGWLGAATWLGGAPIAVTASLLYALWPAGIALASVVGTDIPAATTMLIALALLCAWADTHPLRASAAFGLVMGLAAYFRAVALPLTVLSAVYWIARRAGVRATIVRTAIAVAMTVLVLLPWGLHNRQLSGELYLTDSHGGVTALMGNDPNTEGTYSRSLSATFHELTGRTFLTEPHRETDRVAYRIAKQWMAFDPVWTAGMIALRCERLFAPERGLLYWPIYRTGVLPDGPAAWFNQHRAGITAVVDLFYLVLVVGFAAGVAFACVERRWTALVPLPFAAGLAGTYALFVAEPRYRLTSEVLLFPIVAYGLARVVTSSSRLVQAAIGPALHARAVGGTTGSPTQPPPDDRARDLIRARRGLLGALCAVGAVVVLALIVVRGGELVRARHRWAVSIWHVDGHAEAALWRGLLPAGSNAGPSPVRAAPPDVRLSLGPGQRAARADVVVPDADLAAGLLAVSAHVAWEGDRAPGAGVSLTIGDAIVALPPANPGTLSMAAGAAGADGADVRAIVRHAGGPIRLSFEVSAPVASPSARAVLIGDVAVARTGESVR